MRWYDGCQQVYQFPSGVVGVSKQGMFVGICENIHARRREKRRNMKLTLFFSLLRRIKEKFKEKVPPRLELGLLDSESNVLTTRPWNPCKLLNANP